MNYLSDDDLSMPQIAEETKEERKKKEQAVLEISLKIYSNDF